MQLSFDSYRNNLLLQAKEQLESLLALVETLPAS